MKTNPRRCVRSVGRAVVPAQHGGDSKHLKHIAGEVHRLQIFRHIAAGDGQVPAVKSHDVLERMGLRQITRLRAVEPIVLLFSGFVQKCDIGDAVGSLVGPWIHEYGINNAEDGDRRADA